MTSYTNNSTAQQVMSPVLDAFVCAVIGCIDELSAGTWLSPLLSAMSRVFGCSPLLLHV